MPDIHLDLRGLKCPLPALRTRKALGALAPGDVLVVQCTDPLAGIDIPHVARQSAALVDTTAHDVDVWTFRIRKD